MPRGSDDLLSIGAFANLARLSQKALRLYDKKGLLRPARIDPANGYRSYRRDQLAAARKIYLLRELGLPLAAIARLLAAGAEDAEALLAEERRRLEAKGLRDRRILDHLSAARPPGAASRPVIVMELPAQQVLSMRRRVAIAGLSAFIAESRAALAAKAEASGIAVAGPAMAIFHGPVNRFCDGPVEVSLPLARGLDVAAPMTCRRLPESSAATLEVTGAAAHFPAILTAYDATWSAIEEEGWQHAGPPREIYGALMPGSGHPRAETTVARPFRRA